MSLEFRYSTRNAAVQRLLYWALIVLDNQDSLVGSMSKKEYQLLIREKLKIGKILDDRK